MLRKGTRRCPKATRLPHLAEHAGRGGKLVGSLFGQSSARLRQSFKSLPLVRAHETPERPQREKQARVERLSQSFTRIGQTFTQKFGLTHRRGVRYLRPRVFRCFRSGFVGPLVVDELGGSPVTELAQLQMRLEHGVRCLAEREARVPPG
jgi:hypothetical protein